LGGTGIPDSEQKTSQDLKNMHPAETMYAYEAEESVKTIPLKDGRL
jgi:hypothetical protein